MMESARILSFYYLIILLSCNIYDCKTNAQGVTTPASLHDETKIDIPEDKTVKKPAVFESHEPKSYAVINSSLANVSNCQVKPVEGHKSTYEIIMEHVSNGARLMTFNLDFKDYANNPLLVNMSNNYKSNLWYRTYDLHAYTLLSFPFNYKMLSFWTLSHGTNEMSVMVEDSPKGCFGSLQTDKKLATIAEIVAKDFDLKRNKMYGEKPHACHQFVKEDGGYGVFEFQCCRIRESDGKLECNEHEPAQWIRELYKYVATLQVLAFLTGPIFLGGIFLKMSLRQRGYEVKLDEPIRGTLTVENKLNEGQNSAGDFKSFKSAIKRPQLLDKCIEKIGSGRRKILIKSLMLLVNEQSLITEDTVPVGFFKFIFSDILFCGIKKWEPFTSCFEASIFGPFRCFGLKYLTWGAVMKAFGATLGVIILPLPFYLRMAAYYLFEEKELLDQNKLLSQLGLQEPYQHNLLYYLSPNHPFFILVFSVYILAWPVLMILRQFNANLFSQVTIEAFRDLKEVFKVEAIRLFVTYLFLPLEKWGLFGIIIGLFYWPIAMPFFFVLVSIYCIPTLYLTCRFLILKRPHFLTNKYCRLPASEAVRNLNVSRFPKYESQVDSMNKAQSKKVRSLEDSLLLGNISRKMVEESWRDSQSSGCFARLGICFLRICMGLTCIVLMYSVLAIFSEAFGFYVEVIIFTIMGSIVNANSSAKFIAVIFMLIAYCTSCFSSLSSKYQLLNQMVFKQIKDKLHNKIRSVAKLRMDKQISSAFKYLTHEEQKMLHRTYAENAKLKATSGNHTVDVSTIYDHLESKDGKLFWKVNGLVMFLDRRDTPRIPSELFLRVSDAEGVPDNPGSIPVNMLRTLKQLLYMVIFLSFVVLVVITFHQVYLMSTTNQLLLTLGGGVVPLMIKNFMTPSATTKSFADKGYINYAFEGCVTETVEEFQQTWPVFDLNFDFVDDLEDESHPNDNNFRPPQIHLKFNVAKNRLSTNQFAIAANYDEPFNAENIPLTNKADDHTDDPWKLQVDAVKAMDTVVTIDFVNGKCGVKDFNYV